MRLWGYQLDPLTMVAVIMTAGLGVDLTVHIAFHYLRVRRQKTVKDRMYLTFQNCGLSTLKVTFKASFFQLYKRLVFFRLF